jgi:polysaccharide biosynthesis transport protein
MLNFNLDFYFRVIRKWLWLVIVVAVLVGGGVYYLLNQQENEYKTSILVNVGSYLYVPNPDFNAFRLSQELTETYARLVTTDNILQPTIDALGLDVNTGYIRKKISTDIVPNTSLLEIGITYPEPELAAAIANTLGEQLALNSTSLTPQLRSQINLAQTQIDLLNAQLNDLKDQLDTTNERLNAAENDEDQALITSLTAQRSSLIDQINNTAATIAQFSENITQIEQGSTTITIQEAATIPDSPVGRSTMLFTALAALGAGMVVAGATILLEAADTKVRSEDAVESGLGIPVKGTVRTGSRRAVLTSPPQHAQTLEDYQMLCTNLLYSNHKDRRAVYILTSPTKNEQKDSVIANVALAAADRGSRVLLVDADLRNPQLHTRMNLSNDVGLVDFLHLTLDELNDEDERNKKLREVLQQTETDNLSIMTSGPVGANPLRMLESPTIIHWLDMLMHTPHFDIVLVNTPPVLLYSDASALAAKSDVDVVLVVQNATTRMGHARAAQEKIVQIGGQTVGIIYGR